MQSATKIKLLALVLAVSHFSTGEKVTSMQTEPSHQVARYLESLVKFNFLLEHRTGTKHRKLMASAVVWTALSVIALRAGTVGYRLTTVTLAPTVLTAELEQLQE